MRCSSSLLIAVGGIVLFGVPQVNVAQLDGPGGSLLEATVAVVVGTGGGSLIGSGEAVVVVGIGPLASQVAQRANVGDGWQTGHVSVGEVRWSQLGQLIADHNWPFVP
jgi:hypothetical protein